MSKEIESPAHRVCELIGVCALADWCECDPAAVSQWKSKNTVPSGRCIQIEEAQVHYLGKVIVSRYEMRPDIFGPSPKRK